VLDEVAHFKDISKRVLSCIDKVVKKGSTGEAGSWWLQLRDKVEEVELLIIRFRLSLPGGMGSWEVSIVQGRALLSILLCIICGYCMVQLVKECRVMEAVLGSMGGRS